MQNKILDELVQEVDRSSNASYLLKQSDMFYDIGFRVMKNQKGESLLDCHRLKYNGKIKLVYFTNELIPLSQILAGANADMIALVINNLMNAIRNVESNGFLNVLCIDNRLDRIYVEQNTLAVKLIYLPLNVPINAAAKGSFESEIRAQLVKVLQEVHMMENPRVHDILDALTDGTISLPEISQRVHKSENYILVGENPSVSIPITKNEFLVGKNPDRVDGVITGNSAISRVHCKFLLQNQKIFIKDMNSANGTFVAGQKVSSDSYMEIEDGAKIKLANMEFTIRR